jgi:nucleotide-binding universal stress UspA family protein
MASFEHVLIPVDFPTGSPSALMLGGAIAKADGAQLTLLHVHPRFDRWERGADRPPAPLNRETRLRLLRGLEKLAEPWRTGSGGVNLVLREGEPGAEIITFAERHGVDLVALETAGQSGIDRLILGSVAERVLRSAHGSVLAVHSAQDPRPVRLDRLSEIVCALDLSEASEVTLERALALAAVTGARVTVLHVVDAWHWDDPLPLARFHDEQARRLLADSANERLAELLGRRAPCAGVQSLITFGRPHSEILRVARQYRADAIVMGVRSKPSVVRFLFGSTAQAVLREAASVVLMVRAPIVTAAPVDEDAHRQVEVS